MQPEEDERHKKDQAYGAAQLPVPPFPPEDKPELVERHGGVLGLELGRALIELELVFPVRLRERRDGTGDRLPLGDRQATVGQACRSPDDDHRDDHQGDDEQPVGNSLARGTCVIGHATSVER